MSPLKLAAGCLAGSGGGCAPEGAHGGTGERVRPDGGTVPGSPGVAAAPPGAPSANPGGPLPAGGCRPWCPPSRLRPGSRGEGSGLSLAFAAMAATPRRASPSGRGAGWAGPFPTAEPPGVPKGGGVFRPPQGGPGCPAPAAPCAPTSPWLCRGGAEEAPRRGAGAFPRSLGQSWLPSPASLEPRLDLLPAGAGGSSPLPLALPGCRPSSPPEKRKRVGFAPRALIWALPAAPSFRRSHRPSPERPL